MDLLDAFLLQAVASPWLVAIMFALAVIDGFFPPLPSETLLVAAAAAAAASGDLALVVPLGLAAAAGAWVGDNLAYQLGRRIGTDRFAWGRRPGVAAAFRRAEQALEHRGAPLIIGARYIPVGRVAVNLSAGALGYPRRRFAAVSAVAGLAWAGYGTLIGVVAGRWFDGQPVLSAVLGVAVAIVLGIVIDRIAAARRRRAEAAASLMSDAPQRNRDPVRSIG
ncbi:DedA family protein [Agromyces sp. LHK192]|uniref:DedA family protein n=1 Tax=Agromyces sp. LHK192 TaxID=2498704 RepID=UPI000FDC9E34|nr:VTT domain-containing protein [Agromyces sp. LHK192]